jgi:hypothetical protein
MSGSAPPVRPGEEPAASRLRSTETRLVLVLYLATLLTDAIRKLAGLSGSIIGITYLIVGAIYVICLPGILSRRRVAPPFLAVCLILLSLWCLIVASIQQIPAGMALLGWVSYVFFVPLFYVGAELMAEDHRAARVLRVAAIAGGIIGLGAIVSAILGQSAPTLLQPIIPSVGIHSSNDGNVYLAPSIFATAEVASEQLLIALFAWAALEHLPSGRLKRVPSAALGALMFGGLFAAERRADIYVAVVGIIAIVILDRMSTRPASAQPAPQAPARTRGRLWAALFAAAVGSVILVSFLGASKLVLFFTSSSPGGRLSLMFSASNPIALTGQGTGTSTQGVGLIGVNSFSAINSHGPYTGYILNGRDYITAEGGLTKTWLELGIVGVLLYGGVFLSILGPPIRSVRRIDGTGRALIVLTVALGIIFLKGHQSLDNPLVQPLYWLAAGGAWGRMHALEARPQQQAPAAKGPAPASFPTGAPTTRA